jgi:hypothetical protein
MGSRLSRRILWLTLFCVLASTACVRLDQVPGEEGNVPLSAAAEQVPVTSGAVSGTTRSGPGRLSGQVLDSKGQPAVGAEVKATFHGPHTASGVTGADGRFTLEVREGTYRLSARYQGLAGANAASIKVNDGEHIQGVVIRLTTSGTLKGQVAARKTGQAIAYASLWVQEDVSRTSTRVTADEHGHFTLESLTAGKYHVNASATGYASQRLAGVLVEPAATREVKVELVRTGTIEGVVRDTNGAPVPELSVIMRLESGKNSLAHDESGISLEAIGHTTDAQGRYRLPKMAGTVRLRVYRSITALGEEKLVQVPEDGTVTVDFVVPAPGPMGTVVGTVRRPDGSPLGSVRLYISATPGGQDRRLTFPGPEGRYELRLPVGTHTLRALDEGNGWGPAQTVTVEEGKPVTVDLSLRAFVETTGVLLTPEGRPAAGVFVLASLDDAMTNHTDAQGRFVLKSAPGAAGQETDAWFSSRDGMTAWERIKVGSKDGRFQLRPSATLKGRVVSNGARVEGFRLIIDQAVKPPYYSFSTVERELPQDSFVVDELPPMTVAVLVRTFDGRAGKAEVALEPGKETTVEVPLGTAGWIRGRLVAAGDGGTFHPQQWIHVDAGQRQERRTSSDHQSGRFEVLGLEPGSHVLTVGLSMEKGALVEKRFDIRVGQFLDLGDIPVPARK